MPTKKMTKSDKSISEKAKTWTSKVSKKSKKDSEKKVMIKRRTSDLTLTKASAVAIASQANRAQKQALIKKLESEPMPKKNNSKSVKIPLWVWIFFWWSLLLFCIAFYKAIICPQLEELNSDETINEWTYWTDSWNGEESSDAENIANGEGNSLSLGIIDQNSENEIQNNQDAEYVIQNFFAKLSDKDFESALGLLTNSLRNTSEIRNHFTSFRMSPFLEWIEWKKINPVNIKYLSTSASWKDRYSFDISYVLSSTQQTYDETWEVSIDKSSEEMRVASIVCTTTRCSYHPIFWPEKFWLMR